MSQSPKNRADILDLAQKVLNVLSSHPNIFTNPPLDLDAYRQNLQADYNLHDKGVSLQAALAEANDKVGQSTDQIGEQGSKAQ
jgi:hypothetical protein